jgi:hypothetical protein
MLAGCGSDSDTFKQYGLLGMAGIYPTHEEQARRKAAWNEAQHQAAERGVEPGSIGVGDTPEYVRLQWGNPVDISVSTYAGMQSEWWKYVTGEYSSSYVHFVNGRVYAIHQ